MLRFYMQNKYRFTLLLLTATWFAVSPIQGAEPACSAPPSGLVSWWAGEGNALDTYGANNGTVIGSMSYTNGKVWQCFQYNGGINYIRVPASSTLNVGAGSGFTLEAWISPSSAPTQMPIFEWGDGYGLQFWTSSYGSANLFANLYDINGVHHKASSEPRSPPPDYSTLSSASG